MGKSTPRLSLGLRRGNPSPKDRNSIIAKYEQYKTKLWSCENQMNENATSTGTASASMSMTVHVKVQRTTFLRWLNAQQFRARQTRYATVSTEPMWGYSSFCPFFSFFLRISIASPVFFPVSFVGGLGWAFSLVLELHWHYRDILHY